MCHSLALLSSPRASLTLGRRMCSALFRLAPPAALALGRLPAVQQRAALRILAVAWVPRPGRENAATALPVALPPRKPLLARRRSRGSGKLFLSHGRWCSRWGRPKDCALVLRAPFCAQNGLFLRSEWHPAVVPRRRSERSWGQYNPYSPDSRPPRCIPAGSKPRRRRQGRVRS